MTKVQSLKRQAMTEYQRRTRLLIVGDNQFDIEEVIRLSSSSSVIIEQAQDTEWAVEQFDKGKTEVLVLCHSRVEQAHRFYMTFLMFSEKAMDTPHQTILMCDGKEADKAYPLCAAQTLDDYVVYKPLFDIHRLKFAITQAAERLKSVNYKKLMELRLASMVDEIKNLKIMMQDQVKKSHRYQKEAKRNEHALEDIIREGFDRIKTKLEELNGTGAIRINDPDMLNRVYNQVQQEELEKIAERHEQHTNSRNEWVDGVKADLHKAESVQTELPAVVADDIAERRVLIVEDELVNQKMMSMILAAEGFSIKVASDGLEAVTIADKWLPHVILMDIRMPKMNGLKVTQKLKANPKFKDTIIIMLTAHSEKVVVRECLRSGASDFIVKPAKKVELLERINHFLQVKRHD